VENDIAYLTEIKRLKAEIERLKSDNPAYCKFIRNNGITQGQGGEVECAECETWLKMKAIRAAANPEKIAIAVVKSIQQWRNSDHEDFDNGMDVYGREFFLWIREAISKEILKGGE